MYKYAVYVIGDTGYITKLIKQWFVVNKKVYF